MCIKSCNKKNFMDMIFPFSLKNGRFIEESRKWFPFISVITYTEIHFLPSFILFAQSAQLNHFLHDSFGLQRGKNILLFRKILRKKSDNFIFFFQPRPQSNFFSLNFFGEFSENNQNTAFQNKK